MINAITNTFCFLPRYRAIICWVRGDQYHHQYLLFPSQISCRSGQRSTRANVARSVAGVRSVSVTWSAATPPVYVLRATSKTPSLDSVQVSTTEQRNTRNSMYVCACADPGGGQGGLGPPPSPQNIAPPNSEARAKRALPPPPGGQEGLGPPPYKILDPPMMCVCMYVCVHVCMYVSCMYLCNYLLVCSYPSVYVFI